MSVPSKSPDGSPWLRRIRGAPPLLRLFEARKLDDDDAPGRPLAFEDLGAAAPGDESSTECGDRGQDHATVLLVTNGVFHVNDRDY